ncbi:hypothetical protein KFZ56_13590 [Virgibacillus sp. NKC19-3]|uniref:hypothetical protein n=1 Tax=Virgibacillus saliphilus TaxID=2831674 RepID=UPI001C9AE0B7|nr:hypothetical protein [Virgibacillus sp. NKC19-3]MBY7144060.1 hypothetical protein [Virgibacillus sp. NKC19-3]
MRLDELDLSPVVVKVKVNLMLGKRKGNMPLHQGSRALAGKAVPSRPSFVK